mgnify:CR=1 FL=1
MPEPTLSVDEILAIDPDAGQVVRRFSTGDSKGNTAQDSRHFFINLALDAKVGVISDAQTVESRSCKGPVGRAAALRLAADGVRSASTSSTSTRSTTNPVHRRFYPVDVRRGTTVGVTAR